MSDVGKSLLKGAAEALQYAKTQKTSGKIHKVKVPAQIDVASIREKLKMSRKQFSNKFGFSVRTLEKWERGERIPEEPTRAYLMVIEKNPKAVLRVLSS